MGTIRNENITNFLLLSFPIFNKVFFIDIKFNLTNKIRLKRKLLWLKIVLGPLLFFIGSGDLGPDMQDTRTLILNMDFHGKS